MEYIESVIISTYTIILEHFSVRLFSCPCLLKYIFSCIVFALQYYVLFCCKKVLKVKSEDLHLLAKLTANTVIIYDSSYCTCRTRQ